MAGGGSSIESGEPEFQVAPMIDVLLVLLIFFMSIVTAQVEQVDKEIRLPVAPDTTQPKPNPDERTVNVRWNAVDAKATLTYMGKEWEDREVLVEELRKEADKRPHPSGVGSRLVVRLRADKEAPAKEVYAAMQVIGQVTAKIAFAANNK
jgi:biopolymer transport protein ExbD